MTGLLRFSLFRNAMDPWPEPQEWSWSRFCALFRQELICPSAGGDKKQLPAWSPCSYPPGSRRIKGVGELHFLVLDYDDGAPLGELHRTWEPWPHLGHTTWSHTEGKPKARIILPLERPVPATAWDAVWGGAVRRLVSRGPTVDTACCDSSRLYFRPAVRDSGWPFLSWEHDPGGLLLDLDWERELAAWEKRAAAKAARRAPAEACPLPLPYRLKPYLDAQRLAEDPQLRRDAALKLGGRIVGGSAKGMPCPECGRASVWFLLDPRRPMGARCEHRGSCGWRGSVYGLLKGQGAGSGVIHLGSISPSDVPPVSDGLIL